MSRGPRPIDDVPNAVGCGLMIAFAAVVVMLAAFLVGVFALFTRP